MTLTKTFQPSRHVRNDLMTLSYVGCLSTEMLSAPPGYSWTLSLLVVFAPIGVYSVCGSNAFKSTRSRSFIRLYSLAGRADRLVVVG